MSVQQKKILTFQATNVSHLLFMPTLQTLSLSLAFNKFGNVECSVKGRNHNIFQGAQDPTLLQVANAKDTNGDCSAEKEGVIAG